VDLCLVQSGGEPDSGRVFANDARGVTSEKDHGLLRCSLLDELGESEAIDTGHLQVDQEYTTTAGGTQPIEGLEPGETVGGFFDLATELVGACQHAAHEGADVGLVVDHQHGDVVVGLRRLDPHRRADTPSSLRRLTS